MMTHAEMFNRYGDYYNGRLTTGSIVEAEVTFAETFLNYNAFLEALWVTASGLLNSRIVGFFIVLLNFPLRFELLLS